MTCRPILVAALAVALFGSAPRPAQLIIYSAPAGDRPAGADSIHPTNSILPDGRLAAPAGKSIFVGTNPLGVALSPDGRFAVVSNDDQRTGGLTIPASDPPLVIGYSLAVVDTTSMNVVSVFHDPSATFFMGVAVVRNPSDPSASIVFASDGALGAVRVFDLDVNGQLTPEPQSIALPQTGSRHPFPAKISQSSDGRTIYVVDNLGEAVVAIDVASRRPIGSVPVGFSPLFAATAGGRVLVSNGGLASYTLLPRPAHDPQFAAPGFDASRSSSLSIFALAPGGDFLADPDTVRMDQPPDGSATIGGADPGSIVISPDGRLAYVALSNVDRVAVVSLTAQPEVVRGLDLRLFPDSPFGAQPSAQALSPDGKRLYVALAGLNAVAILDARLPKKYRYGLIPTGWLPTGLALSPNGRYLYVLDTKGVDGFGMLQKVDLKHPDLVKWTLDALRFNRTASAPKANLVVPPMRSGKRSDVIDHVVCIGFGAQGFDAIFGDLKDPGGAAHGNGEATLNVYPENVTPNLHALARTYGLADNFYAADADADVARDIALGGTASLYTQLLANVGVARNPATPFGEDPEDYARAGTIFNSFARAGMGYRDYGAMLHLTGSTPGNYTLNVPALAALGGNVDLDFPTADARGEDAKRAFEFVRDMTRYVQADQVPAFTYVSLPASGRQGGVAEADRALGTIVDYLSHSPHWSSTAIFVMPEGIEQSSDHVNALRSYALVISPLARRGYVGHAHLSPASVVKTEEEIFGFDPLALGDLLATDLADFFVDVPQPEGYDAIR